MLPPASDIDARLFAKKVEVVADGMCDAFVLRFFEIQREHQSAEWIARQMRKVDGGMKAIASWVGEKEFILQDMFGLADVAAGSVLGYLDVRFPEYPWRKEYPNLARYMDNLAKRESFQSTVPSPQTITDKIV